LVDAIVDFNGHLFSMLLDGIANVGADTLEFLVSITDFHINYIYL
jgi:hypothetical protein